VKELLGNVAEVVVSRSFHTTWIFGRLINSKCVDSQSREEFFAELTGNGKFTNAVGIYRHNSSADRIGIFDGELIDKLPSSVKWIAHNGK